MDRPIVKLALAIAKLQGLDDDDAITTFHIGKGKVAHLRCGDLRLLYQELTEAQDKLDRIRAFHSRETGPSGMVGDYCIECGCLWPCDTRRMVDEGTD